MKWGVGVAGAGAPRGGARGGRPPPPGPPRPPPPPARALSESSLASAGAGRTRVASARALIVASQVAVTCVLVIGAVLLARSFVAHMTADRGYDPNNLLTAAIPFPQSY